ncbi:hypothetical protein QTH90_12735 [Variovorax sp. J2P1-59]|uniref:hypothetical protein n=1 Tax=Variovorax flavidus TaxID=3053501 RepID=UPI002576CE1C|nr:hypothetical protein [Variovorax sp. J2P1-59]MDM0075257.1 hypothetical protein [Variovorax sp. J2P1-59]
MLSACGGGGGGGGGALGADPAAAAAALAAAGGTTGAATGDTSGGTVAGSGGGGSSPSVTGPGSNSPTPTTPDIVDNGQNVEAAAYRDMAKKLSQAAGIDYRYGPSAGAYAVGNSGLPTLAARDARTPLGSPAPSYAFYWQVGGPPSATSGNYSTNQANMLFVADNRAERIGVADFQVSGYMFNTFAQLPQLSWTRNALPGGGMDSANAINYRDQLLVSNDPIAVGRCSGRSGFCAQSLVAYQNGVIATSGSNTAGNPASVKLPANKVPTAIAMTNLSEFALVTVWDTTAMKGQVAVIALAGLCDGCDAYSNGTNGKRAYYKWWNEWMATYPGLPNMGDIAFMKILGYIDLPGVTAPTEIAVTTGLDQFQTMVSGDFVGYGSTPLTSNWQNFTGSGPHASRYAKGGMAVVISKSEQKASFIDLRPLFNFVNGVYFSANVTQTSNLGQADSQWPYTFANTPSQMPTVVKTVSLPAKPTAVKTTVFGSPQRAWIATQDGTLHIYSIDGFAPGGTASAAPSANVIAEVGTVTGIGRNPTSLGTSKGEPNSSIEPLNQQVLVNSRGDRKVSWVRFAANGNSGTIVRTLQDTRMIDPIAVEDADNYSNPGYLTSVIDYTGKAVRNYRYGPVIFGTDGGSCPKPNGCGLNPTTFNGTTYNIEYGGAMDVPGTPFQISTTNVP